MWQVSGGHGVIDSKSAISEMVKYHDSGFTTWDMADIYGPAEEFLGEFRKRLEKQNLETSTALTKFVPNPGPMTKSIVEHYIDESRKRMSVESIDLLQFHWWDYNDPSYLDALKNLEHLRDKGKIKHLGLTNFNTEKMKKQRDEIAADNKVDVLLIIDGTKVTMSFDEFKSRLLTNVRVD